MKTAIRVMILAVLTFMVSFNMAYADENLPSTIRIGLTFGNPSIESVELQSETGFEFGTVQGDDYENLYYLVDFKELEIEKASQNTAQRVFLVRAGPVYEDAAGMYEDFDSVKSPEGSVFAAYDDGWRICSGPFATEAEAAAKSASMASASGGIGVDVKGYDTLVLVKSSGKTILAYDSMDGEKLIKPYCEEGGEAVFKYNGHRYRGGIMVKRYSGSDLTVINYLDMNEYLYGVLPWEMSKSWPLEALKAQAVAARNFAISNYGKYSHLGFNLCNTHNSQAYVGYDYEGPSCNDAVDETDGQLLRWKGSIVSAFYHTNSGGFTENSENIWSMEVPYLKGVEDKFSVGGPHYSWNIEYSSDELARVLGNAGYDVGKDAQISIAKKSENNHVLELLIESGKPDVVLYKNSMRTVFGYDVLKSTLFEIRKGNDIYCMKEGHETVRMPAKGLSAISGNGRIVETGTGSYYVRGASEVRKNQESRNFVIDGKGWGHGLGMSQWGAKVMAEEGYGYEEILAFYYKDTVVE